MAADTRPAMAATIRPRPWSRVMGLGSVYAKTIRDSRRAAIIVGGLAGLFMLATAAPYGVEFDTPQSRAQLVAQTTSLPAVFRGLLGEPIRIETLGGFLSWRIGNLLPVMLGLWSVIALSGTLAGEAAKGSLDLLVSTRHARRSVAVQKVAGHVTALVAAMIIAAVIIVLAGRMFAVLPGDDISVAAALGQVTLYGLLMLAAGALAFAVGPLVGRTRAVGFGLAALFGMYLIASYGSLSPTIDALSPISWYAWTAGHRPLAGVTDWPSIGLLAAVTIGLVVAGVALFERRDIGSAGALAWLRLPSLPAGTSGPITRQLADRALVAIAWGLGLGIYAALVAASASALTASINEVPGMKAIIDALYPDLDLSRPSGILQLAFFAMGSLMVGLAGATSLAGWSSDEVGRRLDVVLSTPLSRVGWFVRSGLGVFAAIGVTAMVIGALVSVAVASQGGDVAGPVIGSAMLGLAASGFAGIGLAAGGLLRPTLAAPLAASAVIATFILDTIGEALDLPEAVLDLSIYRHLGRPMAGQYEIVGVVVAVLLAIGGLAIGAWGMHRRDVGR